MATPVVSSTSTSSLTTGTSIVVTKPTGLAVGDLMVATLFTGLGGSSGRSWNTPSGWTAQVKFEYSNNDLQAVFTKTADSSDVAASNFTFTIGGGSWAGYGFGTIQRVTSWVSLGSVEYDINVSPAGVTDSNTANITPTSPESLLFAIYCTENLNLASAISVSSYTSTPSLTFTEVMDIGSRDGASDGVSIAIATAPVSNVNITAYGATFSELGSPRIRTGVLLSINGSHSDSADISHISITPSAESLESSNTATADVSHINITPNIESLDSKSSSDGTQWTTNTKPSASYNNTAKPSATWSNDAKPATSWTNTDK